MNLVSPRWENKEGSYEILNVWMPLTGLEDRYAKKVGQLGTSRAGRPTCIVQSEQSLRKTSITAADAFSGISLNTELSLLVEPI